MENRVEELRKHLGLNQEDFAKAIRVSRQTVSSIETGKYNPSVDVAVVTEECVLANHCKRANRCR